jgi:hypothetical protein
MHCPMTAHIESHKIFFGVVAQLTAERQVLGASSSVHTVGSASYLGLTPFAVIDWLLGG